MSKIDDKSGYDHVLLTKELTKYFGIQWGGLWWVYNIFPFRHQSQVSLFLSEKIRFWNSRLYVRETTLDILCSRERRGRLYYSGIREPSDIERSEGLLSGYEGRAIGSRNLANSSGSFLYLAIEAFIGKRVNGSDLSATQLFVLIRDQAFLKT